jgi:succinyl-CoA synthetase beta subunit
LRSGGSRIVACGDHDVDRGRDGDLAEKHPEKILRVSIDPAAGISGFHARKRGFGLG